MSWLQWHEVLVTHAIPTRTQGPLPHLYVGAVATQAAAPDPPPRCLLLHLSCLCPVLLPCGLFVNSLHACTQSLGGNFRLLLLELPVKAQAADACLTCMHAGRHAACTLVHLQWWCRHVCGKSLHVALNPGPWEMQAGGDRLCEHLPGPAHQV